eukprot:GDKK01046387.1.p1 GENE.GDKK01046387.1~~GDKK01046387.1.p1  ORF type:complete len:104 (+),score=18.10 GDKK01046387.1:45-314(+)
MAVHNSTCGFHAGNTAFLCALNGDAKSANTHLAAFTDSSEESEFARNRIKELMDGKQAKSADLGLYYERCVLDVGAKSVWTAKNDDITA